MTDSRKNYGAVYIFVNTAASRVKVGMTINDVRDRLKDVDRLWSGRKPTCQICGSRRLIGDDGRFRKHASSAGECPGGNELPIEMDVSLAESYLKEQRQALTTLSGSEKSSAVRELNKLEKRITNFRGYTLPRGLWQFAVAYHTNFAGDVESKTHEILAEQLDNQAPLGEVFCCSLPKAIDAVERALSHLGLLASATKQTRDDTTATEYGECILCGGPLTQRGSCPQCAERFRSKF